VSSNPSLPSRIRRGTVESRPPGDFTRKAKADTSSLDTFSFAESSSDLESNGQLKRRAERRCAGVSKRYATGGIPGPVGPVDASSYSFIGDSDDDEDSISTSKLTVIDSDDHEDTISPSKPTAFGSADRDAWSISFRDDSDDGEDSISTSKPTVFVSQLPLDHEQLGRKAYLAYLLLGI